MVDKTTKIAVTKIKLRLYGNQKRQLPSKDSFKERKWESQDHNRNKKMWQVLSVVSVV